MHDRAVKGPSLSSTNTRRSMRIKSVRIVARNKRTEYFSLKTYGMTKDLEIRPYAYHYHCHCHNVHTTTLISTTHEIIQSKLLSIFLQVIFVEWVVVRNRAAPWLIWGRQGRSIFPNHDVLPHSPRFYQKSRSYRIPLRAAAKERNFS